MQTGDGGEEAGVAGVIRRLKALETAFFERNRVLVEEMCQAEAGSSLQMFYGELAFLLVPGLKAAVLFTFDDANVRHRNQYATLMDGYVREVLSASGILSRWPSLRLFRFASGVHSDNLDLSGCVVLANTEHASFAEFLAKHRSLLLDYASDGTRQPEKLRECELARLLDYPCALPEGDEMRKLLDPHTPMTFQIVEICMIDISDRTRPRCVTTFGARSVRAEMQAAYRHVERYQRAVSAAGLDSCLRLALDVRWPTTAD